MTRVRAVACLALLFGMTGAARAAGECDPAPAPVVSLDFDSRYSDDSASRSEIDPRREAEAEKALRPIDEFLRDLTEAANGVFDPDADRQAIADCVVQQIATWAQAGALSDLQSQTASLTIGSRIVGFGLVMLQVAPDTSLTGEVAGIAAWLNALMQAQLRFWEETAPKGAAQGNLRAWAALGGASVARLTDDGGLRDWSARSVSHVLCTAAPDGTLPQEMTRKQFALKYQLHAIAPLVVSVLLLRRQGVDLQDTCDGALARVVDFAVADLEDGRMTEQITGESQSFFNGTDELKAFHLAWLEAYLRLDPAGDRRAAEALAEAYRPLSYSKLGGKQALLWEGLQ